ncbi:hypothetical protein I5F71_02730 [Pseudomonas aeruginosa]|nr:hypothetical protein [Pseudomonas aeruginosa]
MAGPWEDFQQTAAPEGETAGPWSSYQRPVEEPSSGILRRTVGDTAVSLLKGAVGVPEAVVGIADIPTGGRVGKLAEEAGFRPKDAKQFLDDFYSPEQKAANQRVAQAEGFVDTASTMLQNPSTIAHTVAESAPSMLAGGVIGRGVGALAKLPAWALGAVGEGAVGAGQAAESIRQSTDDGLMTAKQAGAALLSGVGTGAFGALGGKAAQKLGISDIETMLAGGSAQASAKSLPRRMLEGAVTEGALQELPQSMQEQAWQNVALDQPLGQGVAEAGAAGLLAGVAMGAGGGVGNARSPVNAPAESVPPADTGPLSRAVAQLPAPSIAGALPAPEQTVFVDAAGNANTQGPVRNVDGEMRPEAQARQPWVNPGPGQTFGGPGMEQQVEPGAVPLVGEFQPAAQPPSSQVPANQRTFEGEVVRPGIADLRQDAFVVDGQGQAQPGLTRNQFAYQGPAPRDFGPGMEQSVPRGNEVAPPNRPVAARPVLPALPAPETMVVDSQGNATRRPVAPFVAPEPQAQQPGGSGMDQQAAAARRPNLEALLPVARQRLAAGESLDATALALETGASRAVAKQVVQGAQAEQQVAATTFKSVPGANKALRGLPLAGQFEVVKVGTRQWQVQPKRQEEVRSADNAAGTIDVGAAGAAASAPAQAPDVATVPAVEPGAALPSPGQPADGAGIPAATPAADGQRPVAASGALPKPKKGPRRQVDREQDSVVQAAIRLGGLKTEWRQDTTGDTKGNKQVPGVGALWTDKTGTSIDDMASLLDQHGYVPAGEMERDGGVTWLQAALRDEVAGQRTHFAPDSVRQRQQLEQEEHGRYAEEADRVRDQREAEYARIEAEHGAEVAAQVRAYDDALEATRDQLLEESQRYDDQLAEHERALAEARSDAETTAPPAGDEHLREGVGESGGEPAASERDQEFALEQPTEQGLREQAERQAVAERAQAEAEQQAEQRRQADVERNDFTLTGSDRPSDIGAARGQQDLLAPSKEQPKTAKPERIDDFGERLAGARKFTTYSQKLGEASQADVKAIPLSQAWPEPDYSALLEQGASPWQIGFIRAARDEVPPKPTKAYKVERWAEQVQRLRGMALRIMVNQSFAAESRQSVYKEHPALRDMLGRAELYERFGHEHSLKGIGFSEHHYSLYRGEKNVDKWIVSKQAKASALSNWPHELAVGNTKEEAIEAFAKVHSRLGAVKEKAGAAVRFDVFSERGKAGWIVGKKNGKRVVRLKAFDKLADARAYIRDHQADLEAQYESLKETPAHRGANNAPRVGVDYRNGQDVTPELFAQTFGFRGVQFGNYVENGRRQVELNEAFDALTDLAGILNVPARALSLNGELGLAFGARGRGGPDPAKAHYEVDQVVINLTKGNGAGSLAHEWWHALDNYLSRARNQSQEFLSVRPYERGQGVRPELVQAFKELMTAVGQTRLKERSEHLDSMRSKDYWSTPEEMSARAFESYVVAKLADQGVRSDYLANILTEQAFNRETSYPYPTAAELPAIRAAYDNIFRVIETREDAAGNVAFYSRQSYRQGAPVKGLRAETLRKAVAERVANWRNAPKVEVVQSIKDLPGRLRQRVQRDGAFDVEGIYDGGSVYLVADNLGSFQHAGFVLAHEVLGHSGLQGAFGKRLDPLLNSIYQGNQAIRAEADRLVRQFDYSRAVAVEEVLADMAAAGSIQQQGFWPRLAAALRNALRSIGLQVRWTDGDVQALLANARRYVEDGRAAGRSRASAYSRDGRSARGFELRNQQGLLLAPNGKVSKLSERQWHQVRTNEFSAWFGDWQALAAQQKLEKAEPLKLRAPASWGGISLKDIRERISSLLDSLSATGEPLHHPVLGEVRVGRGGIKKAVATSADPAKRVLLADLRRAFEASIYASSQADSQGRPDVIAHHKLLAPIEVDGEPMVAIFTVREGRDGAFFYNAVTVDRQEKAPVVSPGELKREAQITSPANTGAFPFVRQTLQRVNPATVSKVIDGNGEPLVLHHGSAEEFFAFDTSRAGQSTGHASAHLGIFLTSDRKLARSYSQRASDGMPGYARVMDLFATIRNPYAMSIEESQSFETSEQAATFRRKLEEEGYDGIQLKGTSNWVAFRSNQLKSATDNAGAFNGNDPDVRYSRASQREALRKLGLAPKEASSLSDKIDQLLQRDWKSELASLSTRAEEGLMDGLVGIKRAEEAVGVTDPNRQGYVSARLASGLADVMHGVLHYGAPEWRDGVVARRADTKGLLEVLGDLGAANLNGWLAWVGGKRAQMLKAEGRENNLTDQDIAELLALSKGKEQLFEDTYREYAKLNEAVLDLAEGAGLIDAGARAKWATDYYVPFYRETDDGLFTGPRTSRGLSHQTAAIKALKGGDLPTSDLLENILTGWSKRLDASLKNKALLEVVDNLKGSPFISDESVRYTQAIIPRAELAKRVRQDRKTQQAVAGMLGLKEGVNAMKVASELMKPENEGFEKIWALTAPTEPDIIRVQRAGRNEYYRVNDESLLRGLKSMAGSVFKDPITRIGRAFKRVLTTGVTASPDFILRNFIRDAAHAWVINKDGFKFGRDSIKGLRDAFRQDQDYRDLMFAGASFQGGYVHGNDPEASAQLIRRALEKKGLSKAQRDSYVASLLTSPKQFAEVLAKGWEHYREVGDRVENANRLSTYKAALAAGKTKRQAAFEAKDLMDYSLRGNFAVLQWFTDMVPFLNARIQGLYKLGRAARGDSSIIAKQVAMKGGYLMLFTLALAALNADDDRYKELQEFDKDTNWHIFLGDQHFRIPKPFELGLIFGTVPERLLYLATGNQDGQQFGGAIARGVFDTLAFNPVPQFYQPIRELQANRNFFMGTPIEDMSDEGKLPEARFDERTSAVSKLLGQATGPMLGLSPKQLDHLVQGYTGTMGAYALAMGDLVAGAMTKGETPAVRMGDLPVAKVIYRGSDPRSTRYQAEFYDMMQEADQLYRTARYYRQEGRLDAAEELVAGNQAKLRHRPALGLARQQLGAIRKQMDAVYRDTSMTGDQKRARLNELQERSNQVAERIVKVAQADF